MSGIWGFSNTSKHSIAFRGILHRRLNHRIKESINLRRRALGNAPFHVICQATTEKALMATPQETPTCESWGQPPPLEPTVTASWSEIPIPPGFEDDDEALTIFEHHLESMVQAQSCSSLSESDEEHPVETNAQKPPKPPHVLEQAYYDTFPAQLERILDANDSAKDLMRKFREHVLGTSEEDPGMPSIDAQIKDRIRLFIDDPERQQKAYEDTLLDGEVILDQGPNNDDDVPLLTNFEFSGLMNGRSPRHPVSKDDIEKLDGFIRKLVIAMKTIVGGIEMAFHARETNRKRDRHSELDGGVVNFMKSKGRGSGLIQSTLIDDEWPDSWTMSLELKPRHMINEKYARAAEAMAKADAAMEERDLAKRGMRRRDPKW